MLVLRRKQGQWLEVTHKSGDVMRVKVNAISNESKGSQVNLAFEDNARNFRIERPERNAGKGAVLQPNST